MFEIVFFIQIHSFLFIRSRSSPSFSSLHLEPFTRFTFRHTSEAARAGVAAAAARNAVEWKLLTVSTCHWKNREHVDNVFLYVILPAFFAWLGISPSSAQPIPLILICSSLSHIMAASGAYREEGKKFQ